MNNINIKIPESIEDVIEKSINDADKERHKRKLIKRKKVFGGIAVGLGLFITLGVTNPAIASKIPVIGGVFESIQDKIGLSGDYSKYATSVNETVTSNGVGVTLSEVLCDGQSLYVTFKVESKKPFKDVKYYTESDDGTGKVEVEKKQLLERGVSKVDFFSDEIHDTGISGLEGRFINQNTFIGIETYSLSNLGSIPDKFNYEINIKSLENISGNSKDKNQVIEGEWNFKVPVEVDRSITKEVVVNDFKGEFGIKNIVITPFEINVETINKKIDEPLEFYEVKLKDETGKVLDEDIGRVEYSDKDMISRFKSYGKIPKKLMVEIYEGKDTVDDPPRVLCYTKEVEIK